MKNPTFKKEPKSRGLQGVIELGQTVQIKVNRTRVVGKICPPTWQTKGSDWCIRIRVKKQITEEEPCNFRWLALVKKFPDSETAKSYVISNWKLINEKFELLPEE